jgi:hypothetical protein
LLPLLGGGLGLVSTDESPWILEHNMTKLIPGLSQVQSRQMSY